MFLRALITLLIVLLAGCVTNQTSVITNQASVIPEWFSNPPSHPDTLYALGTDNESEIYAIGNALSQLAKMAESRIRRINNSELNTVRALEDFKIGEILISGLTTWMEETSGTGELIRKNFSTMYEISSSNFLIRSAYEEKNGKVITDEKSMYGVNKDQLINELTKNGASVKIDYIDKNYFCLIEIPKSGIQQ